MHFLLNTSQLVEFFLNLSKLLGDGNYDRSLLLLGA